MLVLGIESSCDETACAVVRDGREIIGQVISSQINLHAQYGGVVPELACRRHIDLFIPVLDQTLTDANCTLNDIDLIAVTKGPGLIGPLLLGLNAAKALALSTNKPLIGVNHVEAHLYAAIMSHDKSLELPAIGVVLSGGHTAIILIHAVGTYQMIGQTVDDAIGEAFDKVAKILGLPYPGGPEIERLARLGDPSKFTFKPGKVKGRPLDFSFSGLKTSVLYTVKGQNVGLKSESNLQLDPAVFPDIAAAFQEAAIKDIIQKTQLAAEQLNCNRVIFGGGVTNNHYLRQQFEMKAPTLETYWPSFGLSLDNAAMIAGLGYHQYITTGQCDTLALEPMTRIPF